MKDTVDRQELIDWCDAMADAYEKGLLSVTDNDAKIILRSKKGSFRFIAQKLRKDEPFDASKVRSG